MSKKQISNSYATGGGGQHFESRIHTAFTILMLTGGFVPCLQMWPITKIKLQGKYKGFETDDMIVYCQKPDSKKQTKLLGQIKHTININRTDPKFKDVIQASWDDFNNPNVFSIKSNDAIALITGPLASVDTNHTRRLLDQARQAEGCDDFFQRIELIKFTSDKQREKLEIFNEQLTLANSGVKLTREQLYRFLKSFHLQIYDLDIKGVVFSLLHSLIEQYSRNNAHSIWSQVNEYVQWVNEGAGTITIENITEDIRNAFLKVQYLSIPEEFVKGISKIEISDWSRTEFVEDLVLACIIGSWDENSKSDKEIVGELSTLKYEVWIQRLRKVVQYESSPLEFNNGIWKVKNRQVLWGNLATSFFDEHIDRLKIAAVSVLQELDPKFELPKDQQHAASIFNKVLQHSGYLRVGLAEGLAIASTQSDRMINCTKDKIETTLTLTIREIFENLDWTHLASLNDLLPILAEAAPQEFLQILERILLEKADIFEKLFEQEDTGITGWNYLTGTLWALETLAWDENHLVNVTILLGALANIDPGGNWANRPLNSLITIYLPWFVQTRASFEKRKVAIKTLISEYPDIAWKLICKLLPKQSQVSSGSRKPKFKDNIPQEFTERPSNKDFWLQVITYSEYAIEMAEGNIERLTKLVDNLDNLPQSSLEKFLAHLSSDQIIRVADETKTKLWDQMLDLVNKHRRFSDAEWALNDEVLDKIESVANKLQPQDLTYFYSRLFSSRAADLYDEKGDWKKQQEQLDKKRSDAIEDLLKQKDFKTIFKLLEIVESPRDVGFALGRVDDFRLDSNLLPDNLDSLEEKVVQFVSAFVLSKYYSKGWNWVDSLLDSNWEIFQKVIFLTYLPFSNDTWLRVSKYLGENEDLYWKKVSVNAFQIQDNIYFSIEKLLEFDRPRAAIDCLFKELYDKKKLNIDTTKRVLLAALNSKEPIHSMDSYHITEIIKYCQTDTEIDRSDLIGIEWAYLPLLDRHSGTTPRTLEFELSDNPDFFCEIIKTVFRSKHKLKEKQKELTENEKNTAHNAWRLLSEWRTPPGLQTDGSFDEKKFLSWVENVKAKCEESGHLDIALQEVGKVLYYTPPAKDNFWINRTVANELNKSENEHLRIGFSVEIHNSRDFHWVDPSGKPEIDLAVQYREKAEITENNSFHRLASTLKKIADSYEKEANWIQEEHRKDEELN